MNINYPDSTNYPNLAQLWLTAATAENQDSHIKHDLIETTIELTNRIKNVDKSLPHEEISYLCDRILGQFNKLTSDNHDHIAKYVATLGETGYEHLHKLFQTIGDTQQLPNYFAPQSPVSPRLPLSTINLLNAVINNSVNFFKPPALEGIINLGIKTREWVDLSKKSPIYFSQLEKGIQNQILSEANHSSKTLFNSTSKQGIAERINSYDFTRPKELGINSFKELIDYLGPNCIHVKKINTRLFEEPISEELLLTLQQAFPNLQELNIYNLDNQTAKLLKNFKSLINLLIEKSPELTDKNFLLGCASLRELYLSNTNLEEINVQSLSNLTELKILNCLKLTTVENAQNLISLTLLLICECKNTDLNFLGSIPNLKKVSITYMDDIDLSCLASHQYVEHIYLERSSMKNFDILFTMPALKHLEYNGNAIPKEKKHELRDKGIKVTNNS